MMTVFRCVPLLMVLSACDAPTGLAITSVEPEGRLALRVTWTVDTSGRLPDHFEVSCVPRVAQCSGYITADATVRSHLFRGLASGGAYSFVVAAVAASGTPSGQSPAFGPVTPIDATKPDPLALGDASPLAGGVRVRWYAPTFTGGAPLKQFRVWAEAPVGTLVAGAPQELNAQGDPGELDYLGLTNGREYTFSVSVVNTEGFESDRKQYAVVTAGLRTPDPILPSDAGTQSDAGNPTLFAPSPPLNVTAQPGEGSATVSWLAPQDSGGGIISYAVYAVEMGERLTVAGTVTSVVFPNLTKETTRTFRVTATGAGGTSVPSLPSAPIVIGGCVVGVVCGAQCVDLTTDSSNCGACGRDCGSAACVSSVCQPAILANRQYFPYFVALNGSNTYFTDGTAAISRIEPDAGATQLIPLPSTAIFGFESVGDGFAYETTQGLYWQPLDAGIATPLTTSLRRGQWAVAGGEVAWLTPAIGCTTGAPVIPTCPTMGLACDPVFPPAVFTTANQRWTGCLCPITTCTTNGAIRRWTPDAGFSVVDSSQLLSDASSFTADQGEYFVARSESRSNTGYTRSHSLHRWRPGMSSLSLGPTLWQLADALPLLWAAGDYLYFTDHTPGSNTSATADNRWGRVPRTGGGGESVLGSRLLEVELAGGAALMLVAPGNVSTVSGAVPLAQRLPFIPNCACSALTVGNGAVYYGSPGLGTVTREGLPAGP